MSKYHPAGDEETYEENDKLDTETNREFTKVYKRMNLFIRLYNMAMARISELEEKVRKLEEVQFQQATDMKYIKDAVGDINENTKRTAGAVKQGLVGGMITASVAFILFLVERVLG